MMQVFWLGQGGLFFQGKNLSVMVDPYLSDGVAEIEPKNRRRVSVPDQVFSLSPDVLIFTHSHRDHFDPETVGHFLTKEKPILVLAPSSVWGEVRKMGGEHNVVLFDQGTTWTEKGISFRAVKACHSDPFAIGVILDDGEKTYYITGDTLYHEEIFSQVPDGLFALFLPVNGKGNNMNMTDGAAFCERLSPEYAVPVHWGLFDGIDPAAFPYEKKIIPEFFKEVVFQ